MGICSLVQYYFGLLESGHGLGKTECQISMTYVELQAERGCPYCIVDDPKPHKRPSSRSMSSSEEVFSVYVNSERIANV